MWGHRGSLGTLGRSWFGNTGLLWGHRDNLGAPDPSQFTIGGSGVGTRGRFGIAPDLGTPRWYQFGVPGTTWGHGIAPGWSGNTKPVPAWRHGHSLDTSGQSRSGDTRQVPVGTCLGLGGANPDRGQRDTGTADTGPHTVAGVEPGEVQRGDGAVDAEQEL